MRLNENDVNKCVKPFLGRDVDSFQQAWVDILEADPQTLEEIPPIIKKVKNKAIKQYWNKKCREVSLYKPIGKNGDERFTLESILKSPSGENTEDDTGNDDGLYKKIVYFLMGEYFNQRNENRQLKSKEIELKRERLRLREEWLKFKRDRYESWKKLMEEKGKQKKNRFKVKVQLQREKLELRRKLLSLKGGKRTKQGYIPR